MHSAILGDTWGSIFEMIPKHPRRMTLTPTDDSFLTCACFEFMKDLSTEELEDPVSMAASIYEKAVLRLKEWGRLFPEKGAYSPGFLTWANAEGFAYKVASTNGCLMRNAPVALFCAKNKIALKNAQIISKLFCMPTHKSPLAMTAVGIHTALIYAGLKGFDNSSLIAHMVLPLEFWESRAAMTKNNFIWDAPQSLGIAVSAVAASDNWDDMMQFLVAISGDVDTYAAIAGPLASLKFGEPSSNWLTVLEQAILMDNSSRAQRLACNYFEMKALYNANISIS